MWSASAITSYISFLLAVTSAIRFYACILRFLFWDRTTLFFGGRAPLRLPSTIYGLLISLGNPMTDAPAFEMTLTPGGTILHA